MNEQLLHLINDRKLDEDQLKRHEIVYHSSRFCISIPLKDEYSHFRGQLEYRPGQDPKYIYLLKEAESPAIYNAENLKQAFFGKPIVITEAPIDTLSLEKLGFLSFSVLSARLNESHLKIFSRYTDKFVLFFDNDQAGQKAAEKVLEKFGLRYNIYNFRLKGEKDPNGMLQKGLDESLKSQLNSFIEGLL